jgi:putative membrane protein
MQFDFFRIISYVMPFTYAIHAQGAIVYGISSGVNLLSNSLYVLEKVGILLIYGLVFGLNGLYQAKHREREMLYGGCNRKKISIALIALG